MRLGLNLGYLGTAGGGPPPDVSATLVAAAERLGYAMVWTAEAFSSDAVSLLGWLAARTTGIGLGTAAMQIPARSPAMTAMTAATLDVLSGGRFHLGLGVSGPQVAEGWHGAGFDHPLARTREYVDVVRMALRRERLVHAGDYYAAGQGAALRLGMRPVRAAVPVYLAAVGPRNIALAGEIADGWLSVFFAPESAGDQLDALRTGLRRAGRHRDDVDVAVTVPVAVGDDPAECADRLRLHAAHFLGGMGSREHNFYNRHAARIGYAAAAARVQRHYLDGDYRSAAAAVPLSFVERTCLVGQVPAIAERIRAYADAGVRTLSVLPGGRDAGTGLRTLRTVAEAFDKSGVGD
ncbi:LLM class F420-dependent oxidoreductase [Jidongwangia harbinensis]|uniref:LLM class F420-dependent oxidoreductase n=1 Tax=Jidongwangia harbinensis TaxID=2878561 RepID=UPI001CD9B472|nr:LLM class F420-dependent oxidoreductase [Jidongwangia harbinensis]MCA2218264.1 LLM class F420-dependent oxidoreductase [Jidongwangia harbinensis]